MYELIIANKNYSSWSLRPWVLLREMQIPFVEQLMRFGDAEAWDTYRQRVPSGKVPCLIDADTTVWDSLAIVEYLAERHEGIWPAKSAARTWARCAAAEMHSGFGSLRERCSMSCGVTVHLKEFPAALERDLERLDALWNDGLRRFGGPFLAGDKFTAVDAFFAPVAFRIQTHGLTMDQAAEKYVALLLRLDSMRDWYADALKETFRDDAHEAEMRHNGSVLRDLRDA